MTKIKDILAHFLPCSVRNAMSLADELRKQTSSAVDVAKRNGVALASLETQCAAASAAAKTGTDRICSALKDAEHSRLVDEIVSRRDVFAKLNALEEALGARLEASINQLVQAIEDVNIKTANSIDVVMRKQQSIAEQNWKIARKLADVHAEVVSYVKRIEDGVGGLSSAQTAAADSLASLVRSCNADVAKLLQLRAADAEAAKGLASTIAADVRAGFDASAKTVHSEIGKVASAQTAAADSLASLVRSCNADVAKLLQLRAADAEAAKGLASTIAADVRAGFDASAKTVYSEIGKVASAQTAAADSLASLVRSCNVDVAKLLQLRAADSETAKSMGEAVKEISSSISSTEAKLEAELSGKANSVVKTINDGRGLYYYPLEVESVEARGLCDLSKRPDFADEYKALIRGLSKESIATVNRIINRLERIKGQKGRLDIYSEGEKAQLKEVAAYEREIVSLSETVHCWNGYLLPKRHFSPNVFLYRYGMDALSRPEVFRNRDAIDAGAYIGDSALVLSEYTDGRVFCFEASSRNYGLLCKTIEMNGLDRVVAEKLALGERDGQVELRECADRSSFDAAMVPSPDAVETCRMIALDEYVARNSLDVGLIKIDVEGAERGVLKGAFETIRKHRPTLLVSIYHNADDFMKIKPMIESLGLGYEMKVYRPTIKSVVAETLLVCEPPAQTAPAKPRRAKALPRR